MTHKKPEGIQVAESRSIATAAPTLEGYIRQHPFAATAVAAGAGMLLFVALRSLASQPGQKSETARPDLPQRPVSPEPSDKRRTRDVGAADMEFTSRHPGGKNIEFRFAWKKRPADAPETDWPTDHMGFTADSPDGKHTEFSFTRKTRTLPADDPEKPISETHSGLGQATMEFVSRRPGHRDFRFTWNKVPPG